MKTEINDCSPGAARMRPGRAHSPFLLSAFCFLSLAAPADAQLNTNTFQFNNSDGTPMTSAVTMVSWPITGGSVEVVNGVIVWAKTVTLTPNVNGAGTNIIEPGTYRLTLTPAVGTSISTYANIPVTTNIFPLSAYLSNAPAIYTSSSFYAFLTNGLNGPQGIIQALQPAGATITNLISLNTITNLIGQNGLTNLEGAAGASGLLGFAGITNLLGGTPVLTNNPQFTLALTNPNVFWQTNVPMLSPLTLVAGSGLTNSFTTNSAQMITFTLGTTNYVGFTGTISNVDGASGIAYRINYTNGLAISTNTP